MSSLPKRRSNLFKLLSLLLFFLISADGVPRDRHDAIRDTAKTKTNTKTNSNVINAVEAPLLVIKDKEDSENRHRYQYRSGQRELNHKSQYYEFLDGDARTNTQTTLLDVWLCLACALGWSIWLVSTRQLPQELVFEKQESSKAMGHVLQVSLGEDTLGTGIPVYFALIDYVIEGVTDEEHIQVRKVFTSKKMIEEGFANVEVMYLTDDPTTAILMDDLLEQKKERDTRSPPSTAYNVVVCTVSVLVIAISVFGGFRMASRLEHPIYGWISLAIGLLLLYPAAKLLYRLVTHLYSLAGPLADRPGIIVYGKRLYWKNQCHGTLNPLEIFGVDRNREGKSDRSIELADLRLPNIDNQNNSRGLETTTPKMFPNAGCGFGNFNVHLPTGKRASSSVSSISASASQTSENRSSSTTQIVRNDTSILEKYEIHYSATEQTKSEKS